jgi:hypothetical protein
MSSKHAARRGRKASPKRTRNKRKASTGADADRRKKRKSDSQLSSSGDEGPEPVQSRKATVTTKEEEEERLKDKEVLEISSGSERNSDDEADNGEETEMDEAAVDAELGECSQDIYTQD